MAILVCGFILHLNINAQTVQGVRPDIYSFSSAKRAELANLIIQYATPEILQKHCDYVNVSNGDQLDIHSDFDFLPFHRVYLEHLESWLIQQGHPEYVPLPYWDPATPAPNEFRTAGPDGNGISPDCANTTCGNAPPPSIGCSNIGNWTPNISLTSNLKLPIQAGLGNDICDLQFSPTVPGATDPNGLSWQIENPWHNYVHVSMSGTMGNFRSPVAAIFWVWHAYVDDVWKSWEANCPQSTTQPVDLYVKDNDFTVLSERDRGEEPDIDNGAMWKSPDIWVRRQADGITNQTQQNPEYGQTNYIYVRVRNRGYQPSLGSEQLKLYWAKANTSLDWPDIWVGNLTIGTPPVQLGHLVGTQNIGTTQAQGQTIMQFAWQPPNPDDFNGFIDAPHHFCLLARIEANNDPMFDEQNGSINYNTRYNNNIAWRNISVVDLETNSTEGGNGAIVFVGNTRRVPLKIDLDFQLPKVYRGNPIFAEAKVIATLDNNVWAKWNANGRKNQGIKIYDAKKHQLLVEGDNAALTDLQFDANELAQIHVGFEFIKEKKTKQKEFSLDLVQRLTKSQEIMGGETYKVITDGQKGFYADTVRMPTTYDPNPYGTTNSTNNDTSKNTNNGITSLSPNPATNQVTIGYELSTLNNATITLLNQSGQVKDEYEVGSDETTLVIDLSSYPTGFYFVVMKSNGQTVNTQTLVIE